MKFRHVTRQGIERITNEMPHLDDYILHNLDKKGIMMLLSFIDIGDILVGGLIPQTKIESLYALEDRLLQAILSLQVSTIKVSSLKLSIGRRGRVIHVR